MDIIFERDADFCEEAIYSEDYADFIKEYYRDFTRLREIYHPACIEALSDQFAVMHLPDVDRIFNLSDLYHFQMIPALYGLVDTGSLEAGGILNVHRNPYLNLTGSRVIIGIIDTGIDYQHSTFVYEDNTTKIVSLWDQTIRNDQRLPSQVDYGTVYTQEDINRALQSERPLDIVPSVDEDGHGTFLAGVAAGRAMSEQDFSGVAPNASLCVVKLKQCKRYLRDFFGLSQEAVAYQENDIMAGVSYCVRVARQLGQPLIILLGLGTNSGSHMGKSYLGALLDDISQYAGISVIVAAGNEANKRHHFRGILSEDEDSLDVEIKVAPEETSFSLEFWAAAPDLYHVGLLSPTGEWVERLMPLVGNSQIIRFLLDRTQVFVYYEIVESFSGSQVVFLRFNNPTPGIWTIRVINSIAVNRRFDLWLPMEHFITDGTYFLRSDPDITLSESACTNVIAVAAYNYINNSLYVSSSRGFTADGRVKPDIAATGVNLYGPVFGNRFAFRTGTSMAAAYVAGVAALLMEWGLLEDNDLLLNGQRMMKYLTLGALRRDEIDYPNKAWGYGALNILRIFNELRTH